MPHTETFLGWYVHRDGQRIGPLATEEVRRLVAAGRLHPAEEVLKACRDGYGRLRLYGSQAFAAISGDQEGDAPGGAAMLRVLIVDDCKDGADSLATLLRLWGHEAQVAYDGPAALRLADAFRPEVLLLDIGLPEMDGCRLARQLRGRADFRDAFLVAVTGYGDAGHRARGEEAGFDEYLVKPVDPIALEQLLNRWKARKCPAEELSC